MSISGLATAGYICDPSSVTLNVTVQAQITGTIVETEALTGTIVETETLSGTITEDCALPAFDITAFALSGSSVVEIGTDIINPAFTAAYNRPPTVATLTNSDNAESKNVVGIPTAFNSDFTYQKTTPNQTVQWTLTANDGAIGDTGLATATWRGQLRVGWTTSAGPYNEADILALNQLTTVLSANALFDLVLNPTNGGAGAYLVAHYDDAFNGAVANDFEVGTFGNGDVTEVQTGLVYAIPNGSGLSSIARSDFAIESPGGIRFARES